MTLSLAATCAPCPGRIRAQVDRENQILTMWDRERRRGILWAADAERLPYWVRATPLRTILHWALAGSAQHLLHAAAVGGERAGALLVGPSGSGKSTASLACLQGGLGYAGDDYVLVETEPFPRAISVYGTAKLDAAGVRLLPDLPASQRASDAEKFIVDVARTRPRLMRHSVAVSVILLPQLTPGRLAIWPTSAAQALLAMAPSTLLQHAGDSGTGLALMSRLVRQLPTYVFELGSDIAAVAPAVRRLLEARNSSSSLVSVVIPVLDGERFLAEAIASANAQTYSPVEVIVVDDGSTDRSAEIATALGTRLLRRPHRGVSAARNAGIAIARGDLIALLDADDRWPPERLAVLVRRFTRRAELGFVIGRARLFLDPGAPRPEWLTDELAAGESVLARQTLVARRESFEKVGGFDESRDICEDFDWLVRAGDAGISYEVLDDVVVEYRVHDANTGLSRRSELERGLLRALRSSVQRKRVPGAAR